MNDEKEVPQVIVIAALTTVAFLFVFYIVSISNGYSKSDASNLSTVIGSISTPILTIAGMVLVYYTLSAQISATNHERGKTVREQALRTAEQAIRAAGIELKAKIATVKTCRDKIMDYDLPVGLSHPLYGVDPESRKQLFDETLRDLDSTLTVAAGLLAIAYSLLDNKSISQEDRSYCLVLFYNECMTDLPGIVPIRSTNSELDEALVRNTNYILWLRNDFTAKRFKFYSDIMREANKDSKSVWK